MSDVASTFDCKVPNCTGEARSNRGRDAYLCDEHRGRPGVRGRVDAAGPRRDEGFEAKARRLAAAGKRVDAARKDAEKALARVRAAKDEWEAALRDVGIEVRRVVGEG